MGVKLEEKDAIGKIEDESGVLASSIRYCPLAPMGIGDNDALPSACIREHCAWFVRNGCAIFHLACSAIEWEKIARDRRNTQR